MEGGEGGRGEVVPSVQGPALKPPGCSVKWIVHLHDSSPLILHFVALIDVRPPSPSVSVSLQEILSEAGQLQYASEALLRSRGYSSDRAFPAEQGGPSFVMPLEEIAKAFWSCPAGKSMQASG